MIGHVAGMAAVIAVLMLCALLPFLPGRSDPLAVPLSQMTTAFALTGVLVVPFAGLSYAASRTPRLQGWQRGFATAMLVAASFVWLVVSLVALGSTGWPLAAITLASGGLALWRGRRWLTTPAGSLYLVIVPLTVAALAFALLPRAVESGRNRAIRNAAPLIADIERYRAAHGQYPPAIPALSNDYLTGVAGVAQYRYEPAGDSFHVYFEQLTFRLGTREIVMYNPKDEHAIVSHDSDALRRPMPQRSGFYAMNDAPEPHWKYFWFD
jgi:MFS family permease